VNIGVAFLTAGDLPNWPTTVLSMWIMPIREQVIVSPVVPSALRVDASAPACRAVTRIGSGRRSAPVTGRRIWRCMRLLGTCWPGRGHLSGLFRSQRLSHAIGYDQSQASP